MALSLVLAMLLGALPQCVLAEDLSAPEQEPVAASECAPEESAAVSEAPETEPEQDVEPEAAAEESASVEPESAPLEDSPEESAEEVSREAEEAEGGQSFVEGTVTGFPDQGAIAELDIPDDNRPSLDKLLQKLPEELSVEVGGVTCAIPVTWFCVEEDYEAAERYYYQFSPQWDETRWPLAQGLDIVEDAPYAAVFVRLSGLELQSAESVELYCYRFFTETMELNSAATCGILANIYSECAFKPNNLQQVFEKKLGYTDESYTEAVDNGTYKNFVHDSAGYGLFQFTWWSLKRDVLAYAKKKGTSIGDPQTQLEYLENSLGATRTSKLKGFPDTAQGAYDAGYYFCMHYEKPSDTKNRAKARGNLAKNTFWPKYKDAFARAESGVEDALSAPVPVSLKQMSRGIQFTWEGVTGATKYRVFCDEGDGWTRLGDTKEMSWTQEKLTSGRDYAFTVCCLNSKGQQVSSRDPVGLSRTFWAAPTLTACKNTGDGIQLLWKDEGSPGYLVLRKLYGGKWETPVPVTGTSYTDTTAQPGKAYFYAVRCADENGGVLSEFLTSQRIVRLTTPVLQGAWNRDKGIELRWKGVTGANGFRVYRKDAKGKWQLAATLKGANTLSWVDKSAQKKYGNLFRYTVRAAQGSILSGNDAQGRYCCRLLAPTLTKAKTAKGKLNLQWKKSAKAQGYEVLWKSGGTQETAVIKGNQPGCTLKGLKKGKLQVRVRAWRKKGEQVYYSGWSATRKIKL